MKRRNYTDGMLISFRKYFMRECSKFISSLPIKATDLDTNYNIQDKTLILIGLTNDVEYPIIMQQESTKFYFAVSRDTFKLAVKQ